MAKKRRKKIVKQIEIKEEKVDLIPLQVYFAIKNIRVHHKAGMMAYNNAKELKMSLKDWEEFFRLY